MENGGTATTAVPTSTAPDTADSGAGPVAGSALDNPAWASLRGAHAAVAETRGRAARYPAEMCPFAAVAADEPDAWDDLAALVGPGNRVFLAAPPGMPPASWERVGGGEGVQMVATGLRAERDPEVQPLGVADVPEMLDLIGRTKPGPFLPRTVELGTYLGIRHGGTLVAMAGERMRPPGWTEVSAVCTDPAWRGKGLATRLVRSVAAVIGDRGEIPFLHAAGNNVTAIRLYEQIGFTVRRRVGFHLVRAPGGAAPS